MKSARTSQGYQLGLKDPVSLMDPVWTTLHIALYLGQSPDSVLSVVNTFGFPRPLANQRRNRRWLSADVKDFFEQRSKGQIEAMPSTPINTQQSPKSVRIKNRTGN
jgi:predicted DNA-binding transcriptional regulator AlpA